eukprot:TRINITY_DN1340_c0_g1_i1.p1 TRINITY_DN1340_c0_g1~~TRINITY_DN1340_c0_g1_i1.p1  ORF type:complete len:788 (+),score=221.47 TRINITY_DN1340_c0_g1_i1:17-2380(+)
MGDEKGSACNYLLKEENVLDDSPAARCEIRKAHETLVAASDKVHAFLKLLHTWTVACIECHKSAMEVIQYLPNLTLTGDSSLKSPLDDAAATLDQLETEHASFAETLSTFVMTPFKSFVDTDLKDEKEYWRSYMRSVDQVEATAAKFSQTKKTKSKLSEVEQESIETQRNHRKESVKLACHINETFCKYRVTVMEGVTVLVNQQHLLLKTGVSVFEDRMGFVTKLISKMGDLREAYAQRVKHRKETEAALLQVEAAQPTATSQEIEGYLFLCKNTSVGRSWQRRYFRVADGKVMKIKQNKTEETTGDSVDVVLTTVRMRDDLDRQFCFELISPFKAFTLQAASKQQLDAWINALSNSRMSQLSSQKVIKNEVALLRKLQPSYNACADCGTAAPEWVVINFGVVVCIQCSGAHRRLGVHISKVRSLTLDDVEQELFVMLASLGNDQANAVLQGNIPAGTPPPSANTSDKDVFEWIKRKYEMKEFIVPSSADHQQGLLAAIRAGSVRRMLYHVAHGADINYVYKNDGTVLGAAVKGGSIACVTYLLACGCSVNNCDMEKRSALHFAVTSGREDLTLMLLRAGASPSVADNNGDTPLDLAVRASSVGAAQERMIFALKVQAKSEGQDCWEVVSSLQSNLQHLPVLGNGDDRLAAAMQEAAIAAAAEPPLPTPPTPPQHAFVASPVPAAGAVSPARATLGAERKAPPPVPPVPKPLLRHSSFTTSPRLLGGGGQSARARADAQAAALSQSAVLMHAVTPDPSMFTAAPADGDSGMQSLMSPSQRSPRRFPI